MVFNYLDYTCEYTVDSFPSVPAEGLTYRFAPKFKRTDDPGLLNLEVPTNPVDVVTLKVNPLNGENWTGVFEPDVEGISGLYATPSKTALCVVAKGQGYFVPVLSPKDYEDIPSTPIKKVLAVPDKNIMIFIDYVRICAYGRQGFLWLTQDLSWDGLKIEELNAKEIKGFGWDAPDNKDVPFIVDVDTGNHTGGSSPSMYP